MAGYTNRKDEYIEVSEEHIETAIQLKIELGKESPSGKISWSRHKRMMRQEGFNDSDISENYRQLIKREQKKRGLLPSSTTYAEMVSTKKLESVKEAVGELYVAKRDMQNYARELNKIKREMADEILWEEGILKAIEKVEFDSSFTTLEPLEETENHMVVGASDWHIGLKTEEFNYKIAKERILTYAENVVKYANIFDIKTVYVVGMGDLVNGSYMRPNQMAENEFPFDEQIVKATELMFTFLQKMSESLNVRYLGSIIGNHSRFSAGHKNNAIEGDSAENVIDAVVKKYIEISNNKRIVTDDKKTDKRSISFELNGVNVKVVHGDLISKKSPDKLQNFISSDKVFYDVLMYGHFHHTSYVEENHGGMALGVGCLQGTTEYSKGLGYETLPSQTLLIFEGDNIIPIRVGLE